MSASCLERPSIIPWGSQITTIGVAIAVATPLTTMPPREPGVWETPLESPPWAHDVQVGTPRRGAESSNELMLASTASEMIRYIQTYAGFNNKELGDIFGVSRRSIQNWATGSAVSETNTAKIDMFYTKMMSLKALTPKESRAALLSSASGESFVQAFKQSTRRGEKMLVPTPIEGRFV